MSVVAYRNNETPPIPLSRKRAHIRAAREDACGAVAIELKHSRAVNGEGESAMKAIRDHNKGPVMQLRSYTRVLVLVLTLLMLTYLGVTRGRIVFAAGGTVARNTARLFSTVDGPAGPPVVTPG